MKILKSIFVVIFLFLFFTILFFSDLLYTYNIKKVFKHIKKRISKKL